MAQEQAARTARYIVHIQKPVESALGRGIVFTLKGGRKVKLYPPSIVTGSGINEVELTEAEAREVAAIPGVTYCAQAAPGARPPAPPPPAAAGKRTRRGGGLVETEGPDDDAED
jgi:hypothetical protein